MKYLIGIGNYSMADDSIGIRLVEAIDEKRLNIDFEAIDIANDGLKLLNFFEPSTEKILLVDCVRAGQRPGDYFFFSPSEAISQKHLSAMTTHEGDVLKVIELGKELGCHLPPLRVMGIEPELLKPELQLSKTLQNRFDEYLAAAILELHKDWN